MDSCLCLVPVMISSSCCLGGAFPNHHLLWLAHQGSSAVAPLATPYSSFTQQYTNPTACSLTLPHRPIVTFYQASNHIIYFHVDNMALLPNYQAHLAITPSLTEQLRLESTACFGNHAIRPVLYSSTTVVELFML